MQTKDLIGKVFGRWTVLSLSETSIPGTTKLNCMCSCGTARVVAKSSIIAGSSKSCGCLKLERAPELNKTHGKINTTEYRVWGNMLTRCRNPNHLQWANYGGRGVKVCSEWLSFEAFFADMGKRPEGTTLDRKDNDKGYYKDNCRWATKLEQSSNTSFNVHLTHEGVTKTISEWARDRGIPPSTISYRLKHGATVEVALSRASMGGISLLKFNQST